MCMVLHIRPEDGEILLFARLKDDGDISSKLRSVSPVKALEKKSVSLLTLVCTQNPFLTRPRAVPEGLWVAHKVVRNCIILVLLIPNPPGYRN